ncbi:MAG: amino acid permease [Planctomycetota bacterium]|nr:amino acid permease [Planctomycetota bacterium]
MATSSKGHLKKNITLFGAFAIALGTTISGGFFLLPSLVFDQAGPAILIAYFVAGLVIIPPLMCKAELATAMPRSGGFYFYLDRSLGPVAGSVAGLGTWISLTLKTSFALIGSGYYMGVFFDDPPVLLIAIGLALGFMVINILGTGKTALIQNLLVISVLVLLAWFVVFGFPEIQYEHFKDFAPHGTGSVVSLIGVVMISYMGISKLVSVAEEIRNPERNIPMGIFLALGIALIIYMLGLTVMIGVMPAEDLANTYTPASDAAAIFAGPTGRAIIAIAAIASFLSVANAGILSASRYPLAMARDHLVPINFRRIGRFNTPTNAILITTLLIILQIALLDPLIIAKYAGATLMILFALLCIAVIVMRESRINSYDPGFRTPLYPWIPLLGFALCISVIGFLKWQAAVFALGLIAVGIAWFWWYARRRVRRYGAIYHVFSRLGENRFDPLDIELREIIKEKGLRKADPFDEIVAIAPIINLDSIDNFGTLARNAAEQLAKDGMLDADELADGFLQGTRVGATPVSGNAALPHIRIEGLASPRLAIARIRNGLEITIGSAISDEEKNETVQAVFFLVSPQEDPAQHLRLLAKLAGCVEEEQFETHWSEAQDDASVREVLLRDDRYLSFALRRNTPRETWIGRQIRDLELPDGCLVALVQRGDETIVPRGSTVLDHGDALILIGEPGSIQSVRILLELTPPTDSESLEDD